MRFITILWRNDVFNDPGARRAGAEERPFKLSEKGGWEDWRLFSAELLRLWKAARVRLERPQMKLDICIAFLSVKVTADREAPREKHKHTHKHILHCRDWMPRCHALCFLCQAIRALKWWQLRNDWFQFFFFFSSCVALTEHSYTVVFVCGVVSPEPWFRASGPHCPLCLCFSNWLIGCSQTVRGNITNHSPNWF